jgi:SCY1-like protein 2
MLSVLDFSTVKNDLFPIIAHVFSKTSSLAIKVRGLEAFVILCGGMPTGARPDLKISSTSILDKYTVQEKIVPLLKAIKTKEPAVMMSALNVFRQVGKICDYDFLAMDVLPVLWTFSLGPLLNLQQFKDYMEVIKDLSSKIEREQTRKLNDLSSNTSNDLAAADPSDLMSMPTNAFRTDSSNEGDFERLVLGKSAGHPSSTSTDSSRPQVYRANTTGTTSPTWPTSPSSAMSTVLHPQNGIASRAITPDHALNSFQALKPSTLTSAVPTQQTWNGIQPLQPMQSAQTMNHVSSMQPMQPLQPTSIASNPWGSPPAPTLGQSNAWGITPTTRVPPTNTWANPPGLQHMNALMPSAPKQQGFTIAAPPSNNQVVQKTGLDKYESLI